MAWRTTGSGALSHRHLEQVRRDAEMLDLHRRGLPYADIARAGGYANPSGAHKAVQRALDRCPHPNRAMLVRLEYDRLEALYAALYAELETGPTPARRDRLTRRVLAVLDLQAELTANFTADLPPVKRQSPARTVGVWSDTLQQRVDGANLDQLAEAYGVRDRSAARKRLRREIDDFAAGSASAYRDEFAARLDELQHTQWTQRSPTGPTSAPSTSSARSSAGGSGSSASPLPEPARPKGRRGRRPPPAPGPLSTIVAYWDDVDPRKGLAGIIDAPIVDGPMTTPEVSSPMCVQRTPLAHQ